MLDKWDKRFFELAQVVATWSKDPDCQVGAVLVSPDRRSYSQGYNGFAIGVADCDKLHDKDEKNKLMLHAEVYAILNARRDLTGWSIYTTKAPCMACASVIIQAGLTTLVCPFPEATSRWQVENLEALTLLKNAKVSSRFIRHDDLKTN